MHEFLSKTLLRVLISSAIALFGCIPSYAQAMCDPAAAVRLAPVDQSPAGSRTPLVLIHGIHGVPNGKTVCDGDGKYWASFENFFSNAGLGASFKLYEVYYVSDTYPVPVLGLQLRDVIDSAVSSGTFPKSDIRDRCPQSGRTGGARLHGCSSHHRRERPAGGRGNCGRLPGPEPDHARNVSSRNSSGEPRCADIFATDATWKNIMAQADHVYWTWSA